MQIFDSRQLEVFAFPLVHRGETYGFLFKEKTPQRNVHKHLIGPHNLSLYDIARLKEGNDLVRTATFIDEDGSVVEYEETLKNEDFTYLPYAFQEACRLDKGCGYDLPRFNLYKRV